MRWLIPLLLGIIITVSAYLYITSLFPEKVEVIIDGRVIELDNPVIIEDDTLLIPAVPLIENLGFDTDLVGYNQVSASIGDYSAVFTPYGSRVTVHNKSTSFSAALIKENDVLYFPALKAAEALGVLAHWDRESGTLYIDKPKEFDPEPLEEHEDPILHLAYPPRDGFYYYSNDLFVFGTTDSFSEVHVTVNGEPVDVIDQRTGNFLTMTRIPRGEEFLLTVEAANADGYTRVERTVHYPAWWQAMPEEPLAIHENRQLPEENQILQVGDILHVAVQGSPGANATFQLGNRDTTYYMMERAYPGGPAGRGGIYTATYRVSPEDLPDSGETSFIPLTVTLQKDGAILNEELPGQVAFTAENPYRIIEVKPEHNLKNSGWLYRLNDHELNLLSSTFGGSGHPTTVIHYLKEGTPYQAAGRAGDYYRVIIPGSSDIYLIHQGVVNDLARLEFDEPVLNSAQIIEDNQKTRLILKTTERFPYFISDRADGLEVELRGVKTSENFLLPVMPAGVSDFDIEPLSSNDSSNHLVTIKLDWNMTGFKPYWDGNSLVIDFYKPPEVDPENPLAGKIIIIDPGHGGSDYGAVGPGILYEKDVVLEMSLYLKDVLEEAGAETIMTRTEDVFVNLYDRPEKIDNYNPDLLISVHANAHAHGAQAVNTHGLMTLYNYDHNELLAQIMLDKLEERMGLPAIMTWKRNIAVVRHPHVPTVLVEAGYMMHPVDNWYIFHPRGQEKFARAMKEGIEAYFLEFAD